MCFGETGRSIEEKVPAQGFWFPKYPHIYVRTTLAYFPEGAEIVVIPFALYACNQEPKDPCMSRSIAIGHWLNSATCRMQGSILH